MRQNKTIFSGSQAYLKEIRKKLLVFLAFFVFFLLISFFLAEKIIGTFLKLFRLENVQIVAVSPFQFFELAVNTALFTAIIFSLPVIFLLIFFFLRPALAKGERRIFWKTGAACVFLFILGFGFGFSVMYYVLVFMAEVNSRLGVANMWNISLFFSQILLTSAFTGLLFQLPVVITVMIRMNVIDIGELLKKRKWVWLASFVIPALLPPTDGVSLVVMAAVMMAMFEVTVFLNRGRSRVKKMAG